MGSKGFAIAMGLLVVCLSCGQILPVEAAEPKLPEGTLLYASFDESATPDFMKTGGDAQSSPDLKFIPGRKGKAMVVAQGQHCILPLADNLDPKAGTIHFWWQVGRDLTPQQKGKPDDDRTLVRTVVHKWMSTIIYINNGTNPMACIWNAPKAEKNVGFGMNATWKKDEWHHFCLTWGEGKAALYVDGKLAGQRPMAFEAGFGKRLYVGCREVSAGKFGECADGAFDELCILDRPLPAEQVKAIGAKPE